MLGPPGSAYCILRLCMSHVLLYFSVAAEWSLISSSVMGLSTRGRLSPCCCVHELQGGMGSNVDLLAERVFQRLWGGLVILIHFL